MGTRLSIGAALLANDPEALRCWIGNTDKLKPGVQMPHFGMLPPEELHAIANYLKSLE